MRHYFTRALAAPTVVATLMTGLLPNPAHAQVPPPPPAPAAQPAAAQPAPAAAQLQQPASQLASQPAPAAENVIIQAALRARVQTCIGHLKGVSDFLIAGSPHGVFVTQHGQHPDRQLFSAIIERVDQAGSHVITLNLSPAPTGGCAIEYSQVTNWAEPCQKVAAGPFAGYKVKGGLVKNVSVLEREPLLHSFLMPTAGGCVSVKREVLYFAS